MIQTTIAIMAASAILLGGVAANEASHGEFSDAMGLGHHHMADYGGYHCASPGDSNWEEHEEHMHGDGFEEHCRGSHMGQSGHGGMS